MGLAIGLAAACRGDAPPTDTPYARDVDRICHAAEHSGADRESGGRSLVIAEWLATHLESPEGRELMRALSSRPDGERGALLGSEAARVGIRSCAMLAEWAPTAADH